MVESSTGECKEEVFGTALYIHIFQETTCQETSTHQLWSDIKGEEFSEEKEHGLGDIPCCHVPLPLTGARVFWEFLAAREGPAAELQGGKCMVHSQ